MSVDKLILDALNPCGNIRSTLKDCVLFQRESSWATKVSRRALCTVAIMGKGRLARLLVMSLTVSVATSTTRIMKYKIYHTPAQYFEEMSSHTGYGFE